ADDLRDRVDEVAPVALLPAGGHEELAAGPALVAGTVRQVVDHQLHRSASCASAASRWPARPRPAVMSAISSSQTAVGYAATWAIWSPSGPGVAAAWSSTCCAQSGFT